MILSRANAVLSYYFSCKLSKMYLFQLEAVCSVCRREMVTQKCAASRDYYNFVRNIRVNLVLFLLLYA